MRMRRGFDQQMVSPPLISALTGRFLDKRPRPEIVFRIYEVDFQSQTCVLRFGDRDRDRDQGRVCQRVIAMVGMVVMVRYHIQYWSPIAIANLVDWGFLSRTDIQGVRSYAFPIN